MKRLAIVAFFAMLSPAVAQDITGQATVIDGDTIEIHGQRVRLWGIDAPESSQVCRNSDSNLIAVDRTPRTDSQAISAGAS